MSKVFVLLTLLMIAALQRKNEGEAERGFVCSRSRAMPACSTQASSILSPVKSPLWPPQFAASGSQIKSSVDKLTDASNATVRRGLEFAITVLLRVKSSSILSERGFLD